MPRFLWFLFVSGVIQYLPPGYCYVLPPHRLSDSLQTFYLKEEYQNIFREKCFSKNRVFLDCSDSMETGFTFPLKIIFKLWIFSSLEIAFVAFSSRYNPIVVYIWHVESLDGWIEDDRDIWIGIHSGNEFHLARIAPNLGSSFLAGGNQSSLWLTIKMDFFSLRKCKSERKGAICHMFLWSHLKMFFKT